MLERLSIRNFLLVEEINLSLKMGLTAITGETGAGKSMILGALRVLFGETLSEQMIRDGCDRTVIEAEFRLEPTGELKELVDEEYFEEDGSFIIRRELTRGGRTRSFLQDRPVSIELLKSVGDLLMDFHGQRDNLSLFKPSRQLEFLDAFAQTGSELSAVTAAYRDRQAMLVRREELNRQLSTRRKEQALLAYQLEEIEKLGLRPGEDVDLAGKLKKLEQAEKLVLLATQIADLLEQNDVCAVSLTGQARQLADEIRRIDSEFGPFAIELAEVTSRLRDISNEVLHYAGNIEISPDELENLRKRAATIAELRRKHGLDLSQILEQAEKMKDDLAALSALEKELTEVQKSLDIISKALSSAAAVLSCKRRESCSQFAEAIQATLQPLGFAKPKFEIVLVSADPNNVDMIGRTGADSIQFLFAGTSGQTLRPLAEVASGGESSRVTLAIKSVVAERMRNPLLVYDEIDLGISGRVAAAVANTLFELGRRQQVVVVTHLPQIAARAEHHLQVSKSTSRKGTITRAEMLKPEQRAEAVAALLAGSEISDTAIAAAGELLNTNKFTSEQDQ